jgi:ABC-type glycerol-3-phosphate transport system permease component
MRRPRGRAVLAAVFVLLALNAWLQVLLALLGRSDDPGALTALQALVGIAGGAAAWGSWIGARWAPAAAGLYGLVTAGMLIAFAPLLDLEAEARRGLWAGAAAVLLLALWAGSYLRRALAARPRARRADHAA